MAKKAKKVARVSSVANVSSEVPIVGEELTGVKDGVKTLMDSKDLPVVFFNLTIHGKSSKSEVKDLSEDAEKAAGAERGTVSTLVVRIPPTLIGPVKKVAGQIYNKFRAEGIRLGESYGIPIAIYPKFKDETEKLEQEYHLVFSKLLEAAESGLMEEMLSKQTADLREKITAPSVDDIRNGFKVEITPFCNFDSTKVQEAMKIMSQDLVERLRLDVQKSVEEENKRRLSASGDMIVSRVKGLLKDINDRCGKSEIKGIHFASLVNKIDEVIKVLPAYNVTDDPALTKLLNACKEKFADINKGQLKESDTLRKSMVDKATEIAAGFADML